MNIIESRVFASNGAPYVLLIVADEYGAIGDFDCYAQADIDAFNAGDWRFVGLIVRDDKGREASLWGVEFGNADRWSVTSDLFFVDPYYVPSLIAEILAQGEVES